MEKEILLFSFGIGLFSGLLGWVVSDNMQRYSHSTKNAIIGAITGFVSCIILSFLAREMYLQHIKSQMTTVYDAMSYYSTYNRDSSEDGLVTVMCLITFGCMLIVCGIVWHITRLKVKEEKRPKIIVLAIIVYLVFMPIGMLYTSWKATIVNIGAMIATMALLTTTQNAFIAILLLLLPIAGCIWIVRTIKKQNQILADN